ncbi:MAG: aminodeoxychorismate/anthranilate synthase component II [Myxococcales bacterium]|nr:aminodeoxychorismate/anthranilate synthase component II [Myxococcales bacterium]MCB9644278.1 aminodeoxychorismate/anthranilate synthase component II [Myxococcales bacterium]
MKVLVLDNYDSFTYNLVHLLEELGVTSLDVIRNDKMSVEDARAYDKILLSPGPGIPSEAGIMPALIEACAPTHSILGVCLGHQAIAEVFGGEIYNMRQMYHGRETPVYILRSDEPLFAGVPSPFQAGRYHSWAVRRGSLPTCFDVIAEDAEGCVMGIAHRAYDVKGIQFHPESIMTSHGKQILSNWLGGTR